MVTRDDVREARLRAAQSHAALLGDRSACVMAKNGTPFPAGKYWEGQTAALGELLRASGDDLTAEASRLRDVWVRRPVPGNPREAESYRAGGVDALASFAD
ncbi:hypothetical protein [Flaviflexus huanghaiensis]|uniref:hypothetical protein n=1 Tax=Flaviflexus huanghaiensis TaxID=1111473 RepID=UPI0015FDE095|nr:hypothetical protein [Flaviflexus huanghaiensis]